jgi:hypothetical protein
MKKNKKRNFIAVLLLLSCFFFGCDLNSDIKWKSFNSTGKLVSSSFYNRTYEHTFINSSSDKVLLKYDYKKDSYGYSTYSTKVIPANSDYSIRITYSDAMSATPNMSCSVGTYDGRGLVIEKITGCVFFTDKEE